jgi:hypothetical protein
MLPKVMDVLRNIIILEILEENGEPSNIDGRNEAIIRGFRQRSLSIGEAWERIMGGRMR